MEPLRVLTAEQMQRIDDAAQSILERTGIKIVFAGPRERIRSMSRHAVIVAVFVSCCACSAAASRLRRAGGAGADCGGRQRRLSTPVAGRAAGEFLARLGPARADPLRPLGRWADRDVQGVPFRLAGHESAHPRLSVRDDQLVRSLDRPVAARRPRQSDLGDVFQRLFDPQREGAARPAAKSTSRSATSTASTCWPTSRWPICSGRTCSRTSRSRRTGFSCATASPSPTARATTRRWAASRATWPTCPSPRGEST